MNINLNIEQEKAVRYDKNNALLIEAGPGAGKTRVIIERIKFLLNYKNINPESFLIITFTNKAAEELKNRLTNNDIPQSIVNKMQISTIHSFCFKLLQAEDNSSLAILDDDFAEKNNLFIRKHLKYLGFKDESYFPQRDIDVLIEKYNEFTTFDIIKEDYLNYLKENHPVNQEYIDFINSHKTESIAKYGYFKFPRQEIKDNKLFKEAYLNARHVQIVKSYEIYLNLLKKNNLQDFSLLQVKALEFLKNNKKDLKYKNILVDEFQDTDPVQIEIFKILNENADTFTCVGDDDQSIYGFRGSNLSFFKNFKEIFNGEIIQLNTNYRSIKTIVEYCENFIKTDRTNDKTLISSRDKTDKIYKITSNDKADEAEKIASLIKHLKESGKISSYNDVGLLFRSVSTFNSSKIEDLTGKLNKYEIPYFIKGNPDLINQKEIKLFLFLLYYLTEDNDFNIPNSVERDWLNLSLFSKIDFLSEDSQSIFKNIYDNFEKKVLKKEKELYRKIKGKSSRIQKFNGVFNRDDDFKEELFKSIKKPLLSDYTKEDLISLNISNKNDLKFLENLIDLKEIVNYQRLNYDDISDEDRLSLLDIFYKIIKLTPDLNQYFLNPNQNYESLFNLSSITNSIYNYEKIIGKNLKEIDGLYYFFYQNIEKYSAHLKNNDAVQIMTVHKSKGLEFKVLIVCSLEDKKFPSEFKEKRIQGMKPVFESPTDCFNYKRKIDAEEHLKEERRILYVAMTRAEDILILSTVKNPPEIEGINFDDNSLVEIDDFSEMPKVSLSENILKEEPLELSYTSVKNYDECPFKYNLLHNFNLKYSDPEHITHGLDVHDTLDKINKKIISKNLSLKEIEKLANLYLKDEDSKEHINNIIHYYENYGENITPLSSELPFTVKYDDFLITGKIDLVYKLPNGKIGLLDYKNAEFVNENNIKKQLLTYLIAIKDNSEFNDLEVEELSVYLIKSCEWVKVDFSEELLKNYENDLEKTVKLIKEEKYPKKLNYNCNKCEFSFICKN